MEYHPWCLRDEGDGVQSNPNTNKMSSSVGLRAHIICKYPSFSPFPASLPACISRHTPDTRLVVIITLTCASEL
jgi:hypothetical protein